VTARENDRGKMKRLAWQARKRSSEAILVTCRGKKRIADGKSGTGRKNPTRPREGGTGAGDRHHGRLLLAKRAPRGEKKQKSGTKKRKQGRKLHRGGPRWGTRRPNLRPGMERGGDERA